jgi:hypothetical protein
MRSLLIKNPAHRLDVEQAFHHPWIQSQNLSAPPSEQEKDVLAQIECFKVNILVIQFKNKLEAVVYTFVVSQLMTTQEKDIFIQIF